jgi:oxygen-dependent protoporphyrinogen oxidase
VAVIGGGITGLSAAWYLSASPCDITVFEAGNRLGGKVATSAFAGVPVDEGPDSFLARVPWAEALCRELGLGHELVAPASGLAHVWTRGRLRALPDGLVLGAPASILPVARSGIVSWRGMARAALDLVLPASSADGRDQTDGQDQADGRDRVDRVDRVDRSVADVIGGRFGREVVDRLVEPLIGGINAGRADALSLAATAPQLADAAASSRSLLVALRRQRRALSGAGGPVFLTVAGGLGTLIERLAQRLTERGVELRCGAPVERLERLEHLGHGSDGFLVDGHAFDAVVVTTPAFAAAELVRAVAPGAADELAAIAYASVVVTTLAYDPHAVPGTLDGSGFLVPAPEGRLMTACTWASTKWPELARSQRVVLRVSAGRAGDERALQLADDDLVARLHRELVDAIGARAEPIATRVTRWPRSFPQYEVGHLARVARIESELASVPGLVVTGAAHRGLGMAACIRQGNEAATRVARLVAA